MEIGQLFFISDKQDVLAVKQDNKRAYQMSRTETRYTHR